MLVHGPMASPSRGSDVQTVQVSRTIGRLDRGKGQDNRVLRIQRKVARLSAVSSEVIFQIYCKGIRITNILIDVKQSFHRSDIVANGRAST